jgi:hypothetical protein
LSIGPAVGLGYRTGMGAVEAKVGYNFQARDDDDEDAPRAGFGEAAGGGFTTSLGVGAEVIFEGEMGGDDDPFDAGPSEFRATSVGPVLKWSNGRSLVVTGSGGYKDANTLDPTWYARLSFATGSPSASEPIPCRNREAPHGVSFHAAPP